jgi:hypothetical protein
MNTDAELVKKAKARAKHQLRMDKLGRVKRRAGIKATPTTARRGVRMIKLRQRQAETVELRLKNLSYREIAEITGVGISQAERDLAAGIKEIVPVESAEKVFQLESARLDKLAESHFEAACRGSISATHAVLRVVELRCRLHGLLENNHASAAAKLVIQQGSGDEARRLSIEFVLPNNQRMAELSTIMPRPVHHEGQTLHHVQQPGQQTPTRLTPRDTDLVLERADRQPSAWTKTRGSWMS